MFRKLLVPLDHSPIAEQALVPAVDIARKLNARLDVVTVHHQPELASLRLSAWNDGQTREEQHYITGVAERLAVQLPGAVTEALLEGEVVDAICARAHAIDADLIVMTSNGRTGLNRARLGSVADGLIRKSVTPVLMIRPRDAASETMPAFRRILVPLDGSEFSMEILGAAAQLASGTSAQLVLLRVVEPVSLFGVGLGMQAATIASGLPPTLPSAIQDFGATEALCAKARQDLSEVAAKLAGPQLAAIETHVIVASHAAPAIADFAIASGVDLIAMSTHGRGASRWLVGSVTDELVRCSKLPMLLARPAKVMKARGATTPLSASVEHELVHDLAGLATT